MPGDYSRKTFRPGKHYSGVLMQQGRVQLDSDWNEQLGIQLHHTETEARDVIGQCGVPRGADGLQDGFRIGVATDGGDLTIAPGRIYVGGILCELEADHPATYTTQPHLPKPELTTPVTSPPSSPLASGLRLNLVDGTYLVFLDVWKREITALDDRLIREVALGGPDTATRLQTIWQVKLLKVELTSPPSGPPVEVSCGSTFQNFVDYTAPSTGMLNARTVPPTTPDSTCQLPPSAGYSRLENQLYRVETHSNGTFKWSRDNASIETSIKAIAGSVVAVDETGKDEVSGFKPNQWVEIVDEESTLKGTPHPLVQIDLVDPATRKITLKTSVAAFAGLSNLKLRRWDQSVSAGVNGLAMPPGGWIELEGGIQIQFSAGSYRAGDYWLIPARTATAEIEWPPYQIPNTTPIAQPPQGIRHQYCRLALIEVKTGAPSTREDCRPLFPPLANLTQLHYVSGDGQEARPGHELPRPLQVGVVNGRWLSKALGSASGLQEESAF